MHTTMHARLIALTRLDSGRSRAKNENRSHRGLSGSAQGSQGRVGSTMLFAGPLAFDSIQPPWTPERYPAGINSSEESLKPRDVREGEAPSEPRFARLGRSLALPIPAKLEAL